MTQTASNRPFDKYRLILRLAGCALFLVSVASAPAMSSPAPELEPKVAKAVQKRLEKLRKQHGLASVVAAIARDGQIVWQGATGFADVESKRLAQPETPYRIASITKSMTATAAMQLVEDGKMSLDESIERLLPDFPEKEWPFTVRHLLMHQSGIRHYHGIENRPREHYPTLADALQVFQDSPLRFEPGSKYGYTTYGYTLIGRLIEAASSTPYENYMRDHVWGPAGMKSTGLEWKDRPISGQASLYRIQQEKLVPDMPTDLSVKFPGGGVVSTAGDLLRFANHFFSGDLVEPATRELMTTPPPPHNGPPYALGWMIFEHEQLGRLIANDGNQSGTNSNLVHLADHDISIAVITNVSNQGRVIQPFTRELANLLID